MHSNPSSSPRTIRSRFAGGLAALAAAFSLGPVPEHLATRRGYYDPGSRPQPTTKPFFARWGSHQGRDRRAERSLMRAAGITTGRQKRRLRRAIRRGEISVEAVRRGEWQQARREGWAS